MKLDYSCKALTGKHPWNLLDATDGHIRQLIRSTIVGEAVSAYIEDCSIIPATKAGLVLDLEDYVHEEIGEQLDGIEEENRFREDVPDLFDRYTEQMLTDQIELAG
jgi:hypothetical protein